MTAWASDGALRRGLLAAACALLLTGCVRRTLSVRSDPPGAEVWLNDTPAGTTPFTRELEWYGWYRVTLMKPGYERIDDQVEIRAPLHLWIPLDLAMELVPLQIKDPNVLAYRMVPAEAPRDPIPVGFREQYGIDSKALEEEARESMVTTPDSTTDTSQGPGDTP